jgi:hypothetical protein
VAQKAGQRKRKKKNYDVTNSYNNIHFNPEDGGSRFLPENL